MFISFFAGILTQIVSFFHNLAILLFSEIVIFMINNSNKTSYRPILIPNRTFLVRFGGISGEFGRAMVRILARRSRAKIPMARPNEPDSK